jgi:hypothetical protein
VGHDWEGKSMNEEAPAARLRDEIDQMCAEIEQMHAALAEIRANAATMKNGCWHRNSMP